MLYNSYRISPSLMCANRLTLGSEIASLENDGADLLHIDIMDGNFVPNIALGFETITAVCNASAVPGDVHLMTVNNELAVESVINTGCKRVCFHVSDGSFAVRLLNKIKSAGIEAGIALSPTAGTSVVRYLSDCLDFVLIMTVEPGFAGQKFIPAMADKIADVRNILGNERDITVDGCINGDTAVKCIMSGATTLVTGTALTFDKSGYIKGSIQKSRSLIDKQM